MSWIIFALELFHLSAITGAMVYFCIFFFYVLFSTELERYWKQTTPAACSHLGSAQSRQLELHLEDDGLFRVSFQKINMSLSENHRACPHI